MPSTSAAALDWKLRTDARVVVREGVNARFLEAPDLGEPVDLAVCDVSFISATLIVPAMLRVLKPQTGRLVILVKPQFEVGKGQVGKGGIVRDATLHEQACAKVREFVAELGFKTISWRARLPAPKETRNFFSMPSVRTVGIFAKPNSADAVKLVPELLRWLAERGVNARLDNETAHYAGMLVGLDRQHVPEGCDLAIVLGGDGTLLSAARAVAAAPSPCLP